MHLFLGSTSSTNNTQAIQTHNESSTQCNKGSVGGSHPSTIHRLRPRSSASIPSRTSRWYAGFFLRLTRNGRLKAINKGVRL